MSDRAKFESLAWMFANELKHDVMTTQLDASPADAKGWWTPIARWGRNRPRIALFFDRILSDRQEHSWFGFCGTEMQMNRFVQELPRDLDYAEISDKDFPGEYGYLSREATDRIKIGNGLARERYADEHHYFGKYDIGFNVGPENQLVTEAASFVREIVRYIMQDFLETRDIDDIKKQTDIDETTKKQLIDARKGQGKFRHDLFQMWGGCSITGCIVNEVLRASHIKPWRSSNNKERLDPQNGLLLVATLDALFDRGLVTIEDNGEMIVSQRLSASQMPLVLHPEKRKIRHALSNAQKKYLASHRREVFQN